MNRPRDRLEMKGYGRFCRNLGEGTQKYIGSILALRSFGILSMALCWKGGGLSPFFASKRTSSRFVDCSCSERVVYVQRIHPGGRSAGA